MFVGEGQKILQRTRIFKANCCLKVHNAHLNLAAPISGKVSAQMSQYMWTIMYFVTTSKKNH